MKYEIGDKVEIEKDHEYNDEALSGLIENNYILTITSKHPDNQLMETGFYRVKEFDFMVWREEYIKCLYKEPIIEQVLDPINSRFDILDL
jgi:hypothetical protein